MGRRVSSRWVRGRGLSGRWVCGLLVDVFNETPLSKVQIFYAIPKKVSAIGRK